jgi:hypothetical protein
MRIGEECDIHIVDEEGDSFEEIIDSRAPGKWCFSDRNSDLYFDSRAKA